MCFLQMIVIRLQTNSRLISLPLQFDKKVVEFPTTAVIVFLLVLSTYRFCCNYLSQFCDMQPIREKKWTRNWRLKFYVIIRRYFVHFYRLTTIFVIVCCYIIYCFLLQACLGLVMLATLGQCTNTTISNQETSRQKREGNKPLFLINITLYKYYLNKSWGNFNLKSKQISTTDILFKITQRFND